MSAYFSLSRVRPRAIRPSPCRVRPDWNSCFRRSWPPMGRDRSRRTATAQRAACGRAPRSSPGASAREPPQCVLFEPFAQRAVRLMVQPAPRHLDKLCPDPGRTVTADPLITFHIAARPRRRRKADPASKLLTEGHREDCLALGRSPQCHPDRFRARLDEARPRRTLQAQRPDTRCPPDRCHGLPRHWNSVKPRRQSEKAGHSSLAVRMKRGNRSLHGPKRHSPKRRVRVEIGASGLSAQRGLTAEMELRGEWRLLEKEAGK